MTGEHILFAAEGNPGPGTFHTDLNVPYAAARAEADKERETAERRAAYGLICDQVTDYAYALLLADMAGVLAGGAL